MIKINIKDADRFIEVVESTPKPIIIIDHIRNCICCHHKGGVILMCYDMTHSTYKIMKYLKKERLI